MGDELPLITCLSALEALATNNLSAYFVYDQILEKNNLTQMPLLELNIVRMSHPAQNSHTFLSYQIQLIFYTRAECSKLTLDGFKEKLTWDKRVRQMINDWHLQCLSLNTGVGALTNIETGYMDTLDNGSAGDLATDVIRIAQQFNLTIMETY